ncbi:MAG: beta-glucosidase BglX [Bacteroidales bacterium]
MKKVFVLGILFLAALLQGCKQKNEMDAFVSDLIGKMTVEEKIGQLNLTISGGFVTGSAVNENVQEKLKKGQIGGILNSFSVESMKAIQDIAVKESPHGIPVLFGMDVIHGYRTIFPIPLAISCSWDLERIGGAARIAAGEATANGICWAYSPMVDIARDARWGRVAEGSGEDPWLGSRIAETVVRGYQGDDLAAPNTMMACVKHFALYGAAEAGRDYNTVDMSRVAMYNYYLPPYKAAAKAGAGSFMTSFNVIDGIPATGNRWLLTDLLRDQWGFDGFVVTDYTATNEMINHGMGDLQQVTALALKAGTDMDMVGEGFLTTLKKSLDEGKVTMDDIDLACRRVLEAKYKLGLFTDPYRYFNAEKGQAAVLTPENRKAARELAARSAVLLKNNDQVLPLARKGTVAVIGPFADSKIDLLGTWAMFGDLRSVPTITDGIKAAAGEGVKVLTVKGSEVTDNTSMMTGFNPLMASGGTSETTIKKTPAELLSEAVSLASRSDVIVAVLGEPAAWSGEAASRSDIGIPTSQQNLLKALAATGKPIVLVLVNGRPLTLAWEDTVADAVLEAWDGGCEAGNAIGDLLFGDYNPSGKLTITFPRSVGQIPLYYNHLNTGRPFQKENKFSTKYLDIENEPLYPFGYGLSYTNFTYGKPVADKDSLNGNETLTVTVPVTNSGKLAGEEVVQLYVQDPVASISRPVKELKNFSKVLLNPGETKEVVFKITTDDLCFYNSALAYDWEPGEFMIHIGTNSRDVQSIGITWKK